MKQFPSRFQFRLIPLLLAVVTCLLVFKTFVFVTDVIAPALGVQPAWAQEAAPEQASEAKADAGAKDKKQAKAKAEKDDPRFSGDDYTARQNANMPSQAEIALLKRLSERRKTLDKRKQGLELRENLLKAAEVKIEKRIKDLKALEAKFESKYGKRMKENRENFQKLVSLYEKMKPKSAAKIFNKMNVGVLAGMAGQMKAQKMAAVLGKMDVNVAKRLTMELARREAMKQPAPLAPGELQKVN